ncbi:MAG: peptidylprolyl isomerase [Bryobacteraceae bacterium]|jgi:peptidyl-prolyl cis-trans isomerase D
MFDLFRSRAKLVRIVMGGFLLLVALSMLTYLVPGGGPVSSGEDQVVAEIGKEVLTVRQVQQRMQMAMRNREYTSGTADIYAQQLVDGLVTRRAMLYEARRMGFEVTDAVLARVLRGVPALFPDGQFVGQEAYAAWVERQQNMTIPEFETELRQEIVITRLTSLVGESVVVTPEEVTREFQRRNEKVRVEYIAVSPDKFSNEVTVSPSEIQAEFQLHAAGFRIPEKRSFDMLVVEEAQVAQGIEIPEAELRGIYQANRDQYRLPERVRARHILLKTTDKPREDIPKIQARAEDLLNQLKKGADFAALAKKNSEDPGSAAKGGELGWIGRGQTVPQFESTAFSLQPGQLSGVIKTDYGFHIVQVLEKQEARLRPFEEVRSQIAQENTRQRVFDAMQQLAERAREELLRAPQQAQEIAARLNLRHIHVDKFSPGMQVPEFGVNPDFGDTIMGTGRGSVTQLMQAPGNKLAVAVVTAVSPERPAELAEVEGRIRAQVANRKLTELLGRRITEAVQRATAAGNLKTVARELGLEIKTTQDFGRSGAADGIGPAGMMLQAFDLPVGSIFEPIRVGGQRFICRIVSQTPPDMTKLAEQRAEILAALQEQRGRQRIELFMDSVRTTLIREGKVKIHQDVLNRVIRGYQG